MSSRIFLERRNDLSYTIMHEMHEISNVASGFHFKFTKKRVTLLLKKGPIIVFVSPKPKRNTNLYKMYQTNCRPYSRLGMSNPCLSKRYRGQSRCLWSVVFKFRKHPSYSRPGLLYRVLGSVRV
jgi:hypothetical protein